MNKFEYVVGEIIEVIAEIVFACFIISVLLAVLKLAWLIMQWVF